MKPAPKVASRSDTGISLITSAEELRRVLPSADATARAALSLVTALLAALRDRGVLSRPEIDDVLADAAAVSGSDGRLIGRVRAELDRHAELDRQGDEAE